MPSLIGIDIGADNVKVVGLSAHGNNYRLIGMNQSPIPKDSWAPEALSNVDNIAAAINSSLKNAKPNPIKPTRVRVALPEKVIFSTTFALPALSSKELAQAIAIQSAEKLSINLEEHYLDYEISSGHCRPVSGDVDLKKINEQQEKAEQSGDANLTNVFVVAAKRTLVQSVVELCNRAKLDLVGIDIKPAALARSLIRKNDFVPRLTVDLGAGSVGFSFTEGDSIRLVSTSPLGMDKISSDQITLVNLSSSLSPIIDEAVRLIRFFENRLCPGQRIKTIILAGGGANINGIAEFFTKETGLQTIVGNPLSAVDLHHYPLTPAMARSFAVAAGLAMEQASK